MKEISDKYCPRFGRIALEMGFITEQQLDAALQIQGSDPHRGRAHRLLGAILFEQDLMSASQIEQVMNALLRKMRSEAV